VLWAAVLADVGTCLLSVLHSMLLLWEPDMGRRRGGAPEACRATARSLAMRSQLTGASDGGTAESAQQGTRLWD